LGSLHNFPKYTKWYSSLPESTIDQAFFLYSGKTSFSYTGFFFLSIIFTL
jgi:hypothetical protein